MTARPMMIVTFAMTLAASSACAPIAYRSIRPEAPPRSFDVVAVYPFGLDFDHRYHEAYGKTDNLLRALREHVGDIPILGPEEFQVLVPTAPPRAGSTLLADARAHGFAPERVAVLRARAGREVHNLRVLVRDFRGQPTGYNHAWYAIYHVSLELVTMDGVVLARTVGEAFEQRHDLADAPAGEPYPKLREAIPLMLRSLYATAAPGARLARRPVRTDIEVLDTHQRLMRHPEVARSLGDLGTVARDVGEMVHYAYFNDDLPASWLPTLRRADEGVVVLKVRGAARGSGLRPGDVITAAGGAPVQGPASFARALANGARDLTVLRHEAPLHLALAPVCSSQPPVTATAAAAPGRRSGAVEHRGPLVPDQPALAAADDARTSAHAATVRERP
jgi:hypothetical protein